MQTHMDFRIGMLVRWYGDDDDGADVDDLGIVVKNARRELARQLSYCVVYN